MFEPLCFILYIKVFIEVEATVFSSEKVGTYLLNTQGLYVPILYIHIYIVVVIIHQQRILKTNQRVTLAKSSGPTSDGHWLRK